jgi:hypothetical protein
MPQQAPRHGVNMSDGSDSSEHESDSGSAAAISQPSVSNARMPQNEDMEV